MTPLDSLRRGRTWGRVLTGLALVGACTVVDKGDYTFTDNPDDAGGESSGGSAGSSSGKGGKGGTAGEGGAGDGSGGTTTGGTSGEAGGGGTGGDGGLCEPNPCENGGTCIVSGTTTRCECAAGYEGVTCSDEIDECDPNPCMNNVPCTDHVADFSCACPPPVTGKTCELPRFQPIPAPPVVPNQPTMARAVSADGTIVLGAVNGMIGTMGAVSRPFIWTVENGSKLVPLPGAIRADVTVTPWSLSGDGTFWVGEYRSGAATNSAPTPYGGPTVDDVGNPPLLGFMLPAAALGGFAFDTNHDGSRSVGNFTDTAIRAIQWNANGMSLPLINPYGMGSPYASAGGITRDGSIAAGSAKDGMGNVFVVFWGENPPGQVRTLTGLQDVEVHAVNEDARVTAGTYWDTAYSNFAFLTDGSRFVPLTPTGAPVPPRSQAFDVSDDGTFVVGEISGAMAGVAQQQAVIWKSDGTFRPVIDMLRDSNAAPPGWTLLVAYGISADGKVVVGSATDPGGIAQGFIARLP